MTDYVTQDLVDAFVQASERHFQTLERAYGLHRKLEAVVFGEKGIQPIQPPEIGNRFFSLTLSLVGQHFSVVISYGDREHDIQCLIHTTGLGKTYALWEWLAAVGMKEQINGGWVLAVPRIEAVLAQIDTALQQLAPTLLEADPSVMAILEQLRQERIRADAQRVAQEEHQRLSARATLAFHQREYQVTIQALTAVREALTPSEQKMLGYARRKLSQDAPNKAL